jgi:hypothetical protein
MPSPTSPEVLSGPRLVGMLRFLLFSEAATIYFKCITLVLGLFARGRTARGRMPFMDMYIQGPPPGFAARAVCGCCSDAKEPQECPHGAAPQMESALRLVQLAGSKTCLGGTVCECPGFISQGLTDTKKTPKLLETHCLPHPFCIFETVSETALGCVVVKPLAPRQIR